MNSANAKLKNTSYRIWRLFATGFAFLIFAVGGAIIVAFINGLYLLYPATHQKKIAITRNAIRRAFKLFLKVLQTLRVMTYEINHEEYIPEKPSIVIANHPSLLDVVFLISIIPDADCVIKGSLLKNWLTRLPAKAAAYVSNDSKNLVNEVMESVSKYPLILFPEGTRSEPDKALKFQRGAANLALFANAKVSCLVTPVTLTCSPPTLLRNQRWYHIPPNPPHFTVTFHPAIDVSRVIPKNLPQSKASRVLTRHLEAFYAEKLAHSDGSTHSTE